MGLKYLENLLKTISSYWTGQATEQPRASGSHLKRYLSKYEQTLLKEQQGEVFDGLPLSPLEVAYSDDNEAEPDFEADIEPDFRPLVEVIVEIQQADGPTVQVL